MADSNSKSPWWHSSFRDRRGENVEEFIFEFGLYVENKPFNPPTFENRAGAKSNIDITLTNHLAHLAVDGWSVGQGLTTSDHNIIYFDLNSKLNRNNECQLKRNFNFPLTGICGSILTHIQIFVMSAHRAFLQQVCESWYSIFIPCS